MPDMLEKLTGSEPSSRATISATAVASLVVLAACGGGAESGGSASTTRESDTAAASHAHDGEEEAHAHGEGTHTHATADTLAADVPLAPGDAGGWSGSATLLSVGDSVRILVSVEGMTAGSRHPVELVTGGCEEPGRVLVDLTPLATGASGAGTSQTAFPSSRLEGHAHGGLRLLDSEDATAACAPVHLSRSEHGHAE